MKFRSLMFAAVAMAGLAPFAAAATPDAGRGGTTRESRITWRRLPDLPDALGVAGAFVGQANNATLVAGGANFPDGAPWHGGHKACTDTIHLLLANSPDDAHWVPSPTKLPRPLAYGLSITTDRGVLLIGGSDTTRCYPDVYRAESSADHTVRLTPMPPLPRPLAFMAGALVGTTVVVAGGQETIANAAATDAVYTLDLSTEGTPDFAWHQAPPIPGPPRIVAVGAAQSFNGRPHFYLFSGRNPQPNQIPTLLTDAYRYDPGTRTWESLPTVRANATQPVCVMAGTGVPHGDHTILILGGDPGDLFSQIEQSRAEIAATKDPQLKQSLDARLTQTLDTHPGFPGTVIAFDTRSNTYQTIRHLPRPGPVTTTCVPWHNGLLLPTGEIRPAVRTPAVWFGTFDPTPPGKPPAAPNVRDSHEPSSRAQRSTPRGTP